jgi:hypothetical protein
MSKTLILFMAHFLFVVGSSAEVTKTEDVVHISTKGAECPPPENVAKGFCPTEIHNQIIQILGEKAADCYSQLFVAESKTKKSVCSPGTYHSANVPGNTGVGFGICALDKDAGKRSWRGKNCTAPDIYESFQRQVLCCRDIVEQTPRYFGTVNCGHTPNCKGLSAYGTGEGSAYAGSAASESVCKVNGQIVVSDGKNCKDKKVAFMGCRKPDKKAYLQNHSECAEGDKKILLCLKKDKKTHRQCNL